MGYSESYLRVIERMKNGDSGFESVAYRGKRYLIAFRPVQFSNQCNENHWSVAVMIPEKNIYAAITPDCYILLVLFGSGIVVIMAVFFGSRVVKPLKKLTEISAGLAEGDLTKLAYITGEDELGQLARAFNEMASSLEKDRQKLVKELEVFNILLKVLGILISFPKMHDILPRIVDAIKNLIPCDTCSIMLLDENKEFLTTSASYGLEEKYIKDVRQKVGGGIAGWVALHLKGEEILREARIIAMLDTFDAMTSDRPYRKALSVEAAIEELKRCAGTQFDSQVVDAF